jgi:myo-inositol-1(or 4)-monophosphatase
MYTGVVGEGAYCNDIPINVSSVIDKKDSIICTGFPVYSSFESDNLIKFVTKLQTFKKVRLLGSAALSSVMVATGSVEVYHENSIALWDVAAGIAIVQAAGGFVEYDFIDSKNHLLDVWAFNSKSLK